MKNNFKELTFGELIQKREELVNRYSELKSDSVVGHLDNPLQIRLVRRQISRLNSLIYNHTEISQAG